MYACQIFKVRDPRVSLVEFYKQLAAWPVNVISGWGAAQCRPRCSPCSCELTHRAEEISLHRPPRLGGPPCNGPRIILGCSLSMAQAAEKDLPGLGEDIAAGKFDWLRQWLNEKVGAVGGAV